MARIRHIYTCPKCEESITGNEKPEKCPGCGAKFPAIGSAGFLDPLTISEQAERIRDDIAHRNFLMDINIETANNILNDALNIIQTIPGKKVKASGIRNLMRMAISIGEMAKKYEEFLTAGGTHTPELFITSGESDELPKTRTGEKAAPAIPTPLFLPMEHGDRGGDDIIPR